ncbi:hypothetical protein CPB83DRAFT_36887 [Crepidotus variabilis]|uniref:Uncharacterized protein n=1 Tax=Crepidotus variabilis TaxID=179855 RepID=A0A9P6EUV0_9AGAR|nr:hypothetical protein CPB83DRAFT_36887 [Crepidotus variabilis]
MVLTRLRIHGSRPSFWGTYARCIKRHASGVSASGDPAITHQTPNTHAGSSNPTKTSKAYGDLPKIFIASNGAAALPLPDWNPSYIVPPQLETTEIELAKPKRRSRKKKGDADCIKFENKGG